jgi:hypothetical protein
MGILGEGEKFNFHRKRWEKMHLGLLYRSYREDVTSEPDLSWVGLRCATSCGAGQAAHLTTLYLHPEILRHAIPKHE